MLISSIASPIEDEDSAALVASILEDAAVRLRMLLSPADAARAFVEAGTFGLLVHADYEALIETVSRSASSYVQSVKNIQPRCGL